MKKGYILVGAVLYLLLGCGGAGKRHMPGTEPLTVEETDRIKAINDAHSGAMFAARTAFDPATMEAKATGVPKGKTDKLVKMIQEGKCAQTYKKPEDRYDASWQAGWTVASEKCPIHLVQATDYFFEKVPDKHGPLIRSIWKTHRTFAVTQRDFLLESGFNDLVAGGTLERMPKMGGGWKVKGEFQYRFEVMNIGNVSAKIRVVPLVKGGSIILDMNVTGAQRLVANVQLDWMSDRYTIYANGTQRLDDDAYKELFSSFELLELLDQVKRMM